MTKLVIAFFSLAIVPISAYSQSSDQSRCGLTEATSPSVRGLRLGMSTKALGAVFPGARKRSKEISDALERSKAPNSTEVVYLQFDSADYSNDDRFAGVGSVSAGIYKDRIVDLNIAYFGITWTTIDEWVAKLSETLTLPGAQEWVVGSSENPNKVLRCAGVAIEAAIQGGGASIRIQSREYLKEVEEQAKSGDERKRKGFKP